MAQREILLPWLQQPQEAVELDRDGLGAGVQMLLMPTGGRLVDLVNPQQVWTPSGNATTKITSAGFAASLDGTDDYFSTSGYQDIVGNVGTFFLWAPRIGSADTFGQIWLHTNTGNNVYIQLGTLGSNNAWWGAAEWTSVGTTSILNTQDSSIVWSSDGTAAGKRFYFNGTARGTPSGTEPTAFSSGSKTFRFGAAITGSAWDANGDVVIVGYTSETWTEAQARQFHDAPWSTLARQSIWVPVSAGSDPNLAVSATGVSATTSGGTASPATDKALTGQSSTASGGTASPSLAKALTGHAAASAGGQVSPGVTIALSGVSATTATGTVTPSGTVSVQLTGQVATADAGSVGPSTAIPASGQAATTSAGTVTPSTGTTVELIGVQATTAAGSVSPSSTVALSGQQATGAVGAVSVASPDVTIALSGLSAAASIGDVSASGGDLIAQAMSIAGWLRRNEKPRKKDDDEPQEFEAPTEPKKPRKTLTLAKLVGPEAAAQIQRVSMERAEADSKARKRRKQQQELLLLM